MSPRPVTTVAYDRYAMIADPDSAFDVLRADGGIVWSQALRRWFVLSRDAAIQILRDSRFRVYDLFRVFEGIECRSDADLTDLKTMCGWIPFLHDGRRHEALRALFARLLTDLKLDYLAAFEQGSADLLAAMCDAGGGDLAHDYAERLHAEAMGRIAGLEESDRVWLAELSGSQGSIDFAASVSEMLAADARAAELLNRLPQLLDQPRGTALLERVGACLRNSDIGDMPEHRLQCLTALILLGRDTLAGTLSIGLAYQLDAHGGSLRAGDWSDPAEFADELIRLSSTVQIAIRVATVDVHVQGIAVAAGEVVMVFLPAANHDPAVYAFPHAAGTGRAPHIAFGAARHLCVGMPLARLATGIALKQLAKISTIRETPGRAMDAGRNTRKLKHLPVRLAD
jgi:cytochrome P450